MKLADLFKRHHAAEHEAVDEEAKKQEERAKALGEQKQLQDSVMRQGPYM